MCIHFMLNNAKSHQCQSLFWNNVPCSSLLQLSCAGPCSSTGGRCKKSVISAHSCWSCNGMCITTRCIQRPAQHHNDQSCSLIDHCRQYVLNELVLTVEGLLATSSLDRMLQNSEILLGPAQTRTRPPKKPHPAHTDLSGHAPGKSRDLMSLRMVV